MKKINIFKMFPVLLVLLLGFTGCSEISYGFEEPQIISFNIIAATNTALSDDITGVIEERLEGGVINITVPENFAFSNHLTPTITVSGNALVSPTSGVAQDFSVNPVTYTVYNENGGQSIYSVIVKKAVKQANAGDVLISEVFNGKEYCVVKDTRIDNSYIELYNRSTKNIDLSQFSLKFCDSENESLNFSTPLIGTIAANSTFVIFNQYLNGTTMNTVTSIEEIASISDINHNGITIFDGNDTIQLLHNDEVVDVFDPAGNKPLLQDYSSMKRFTRKGTKNVSLTWNDYDWIMHPVEDMDSDDDNAGKHTDSVLSEARDLTYFAFEEGFFAPVIGKINNSSNTISVILPNGTDSSALKAVFGTNGKSVKVGFQLQETGVTANDFTTPVKYTVWAENLAATNYTVSTLVLQPLSVSYTANNYTFNGNIKAVLSAIGGNSNIGNNSSSSNVTLSAVKATGYNGNAGTITGIVTAKDVYAGKSAKKSFFLQDKDCGIFIHSNEGLDSTAELGSKIVLSVTSGNVQYGSPRISVYGEYQLIEQNVPIYYETGDFDDVGAIGKVYLYDGQIAAGMDSFSVGNFTGNLNFHGEDDIKDSLVAGSSGKFYGPVIYSYEKYRMELNSIFQIELD